MSSDEQKVNLGNWDVPSLCVQALVWMTLYGKYTWTESGACE